MGSEICLEKGRMFEKIDEIVLPPSFVFEFGNSARCSSMRLP